jgi:hypothetical protein
MVNPPDSGIDWTISRHDAPGKRFRAQLPARASGAPKAETRNRRTVPAARPRIVFPVNAARSDQLRATKTEEAQLSGDRSAPSAASIAFVASFALPPARIQSRPPAAVGPQRLLSFILASIKPLETSNGKKPT